MSEEATVVSFINLKGGVGKTSSAINIADKLSEKSKVLVIDMDPQFNATQALLNHQWVYEKDKISSEIVKKVEEEYKKKYDKKKEKEDPESIEITKRAESDIKSQMVYKILQDKKETANSLFNKDSVVTEIANPSLIYKIKDNFDLIPGDLDLFKTLIGDTAGKHNVLEDHFSEYGLREEYKYIIVDCPPNWTILTQSSLFASDYYIIPSKIDLFSSIGIGLLQNLVRTTFLKNSSLKSTYDMFRQNIKKNSVKPLGVLFCLTNDIATSRGLRDDLKSEIELDFFGAELPFQPSVPLKFSLYSEAGDKYKSLTNGLQKVTIEFEEKIKEDKGKGVRNLGK